MYRKSTIRNKKQVENAKARTQSIFSEPTYAYLAMANEAYIPAGTYKKYGNYRIMSDLKRHGIYHLNLDVVETNKRIGKLKSQYYKKENGKFLYFKLTNIISAN